MALKLNETKEAYKVYNGSNTKEMPKLIADGRVPISVAGLMQRRLDVRNFDADVKTSYMDNYFDTGDAVVYHPGGRIKIVLDSQHLRDMTSESSINSGALVLTEDVYNSLNGEEFKKGKLGKTGDWLSKEDVKAHPVWKALARDQTLLNDYTDYIFTEGKERFNNDTGMGIFTCSANGKTPEMRAWYVSRLGFRSVADGWDDLVYDGGRLLGIAPEVLSASGKGASNIQTYTMADLQKVDEVMKGLEKTLHPDVLKPFVDLRKKL